MRRTARAAPSLGRSILIYLNHLFIDGFLNPVSHITKFFETVLLLILLFLYFITTFIVNFVQLINFVLLEPILPSLRRLINNLLQDIILSSLIYIFEWQCEIRFRLAFDSQETANSFGRDQATLLIGNHSFQLDVVFMWFVTQAASQLGSSKGFAKRSLRLMPVIGWLSVFNDSIFLDRDWHKDEVNIKQGLDKLSTYTSPYMLALAPEGTRYTEEKYKASVKYAEEHQIKMTLKHHLLPRVKGFATTVRRLRESNKNYELYNMEMICSKDSIHYEPTVSNFVTGKPFRVDCFIEKVPHEILPPFADAPESEYSESLYKIFERKDEIVEHYHAYGKVPQSIKRARKYSMVRLAKFLIFNVAMSGSLVWYVLKFAYNSESVLLNILVWGFVIAVYSAIFAAFRMVRVSNYGAATKKD